MTTCPECSGNVRVVDTRKASTGKRRRWECLRCAHRWTEFADDFPGSPFVHEAVSDDVLRYVLTSQDSNDAASAMSGLSVSSVSKIRNGKMHADRLPELPRRKQPAGASTKRSCLICVNHRPAWSPPCAFEFPDCVELGARAAQSCLQYQVA